MRLKRLCLEQVGPIQRADLKLGDLTVLVGGQATGKTIFLQFLKLILDVGAIHSQLLKYGFDWENNRNRFLEIYLGEGLHTIWSANSLLRENGRRIDLDTYVRKHRRSEKQTVFYIPAQRVLSLVEGWPRPFQSFTSSDPFVVKEFSEQIRILLDKEFRIGSKHSRILFPQSQRLKQPYRELLQKHLFRDFQLRFDQQGGRLRLVLANSQTRIPFLAWSAGQREFIPLLCGLYWLLPPSRVSTRNDLEWVILEEPEMGLHPSAISVVLLMVFELLSRGYKICLSTHSPHVLDVLWAIRIFKIHNASPQKVLDIFGCKKTDSTWKVANQILKKEIRVYYFEPQTEDGKIEAQDISNLDPSAPHKREAGWGGLTEFSGHIAEVVAKVITAHSRA